MSASLLLSLGLVLGPALRGPLAAEPPAQEVLLTADRAGAVAPCRTCPSSEALGGAGRLGTVVREQRDAGPVLLVDAGNAFFGSADARGEPGAAVRALYDALGYDAVNVSWRDFRHGLAATRALLAGAGFAAVSANLRDAAGQPLFEPFALVECGGEVVAVVGLTLAPPGLEYLPHLRRQLEGVAVAEPLAALDEVLPAARAASDRVVLLAYADRELLAAVRARFGAQLDAVAVGGLRPGEVEASGPPPCAASTAKGHHVTRLPLAGGAAELLELGSAVAADPEVEALLADDLAPGTLVVAPEAPRPLEDGADLTAGGPRTVSVRSGEPGFGGGLVLTVSSVERRASWLGADPPPGSAWLVLGLEVENDLPASLAYDSARGAGEALLVVQRQKLFLLCGPDARAVVPAAFPESAGPVDDAVLPARFVLRRLGEARAGEVAFAVPERALAAGPLQLHLHHDEVPPARVDLRGAVPADALEAAAATAYVELAAPAVAFPDEVAGRAPPAGARWVAVELRGRSRRSGPAFYLEAPTHLELLVDGQHARPAEPGLGTLPAEPVFLPGRFTGGQAVFLAPRESRSLELSCAFPLLQLGDGESLAPELLRLPLEGEPVEVGGEHAVAAFEDGPLALAVIGAERRREVGALRADEGRALVVLDCRVKAREEGGLYAPSGRFALPDARPVAVLGAADLPLAEPFLVPAGGRRAFRVVLDAPGAVGGPVDVAYAGITASPTLSLELAEAPDAQPLAEAADAEARDAERADEEAEVAREQPAGEATAPALGAAWRAHATPPREPRWRAEPGGLDVDPAPVSADGLAMDVVAASFVTESAARTAPAGTVFLELEVSLALAADAPRLELPKLLDAFSVVRDRRVAVEPVDLRSEGFLPRALELEPGAAVQGRVLFPFPRGALDSASLELVPPGRTALHVPVLEPAAPPPAPFAEAGNRAFHLELLGFAAEDELGRRKPGAGNVFVAADLRARNVLAGASLPAGRARWHGALDRMLVVVDDLWPFEARKSDPTDFPHDVELLPTEVLGGRVVFEVPREMLSAARSVELVCGFEPAAIPGGGIVRPPPTRFVLDGARAPAELPDAVHRLDDVDCAVLVRALERPETFRGYSLGAKHAWWTAEVWLRAPPDRGLVVDPARRLTLLDATGETHALHSATWQRALTPSVAGRPFWMPAGSTRTFTAAFRVPAEVEEAALVHRGLLHVGALPFRAGSAAAVPAADPRRSTTGQVVYDEALEPRGLDGVGLRPEQVNRAIDRGRDFLWADVQAGMRKGEIGDAPHVYPSLLALVHCGAHERYPELDAALRRWLERQRPAKLGVYRLALLAMTVDALGDASLEPQFEDALRCLVEGQGPGGSWSYYPTYAPWLLPEPDASAEDAGPASLVTVEGGEPPQQDTGEQPLQRTQSWHANKDGDNSVSQFAILGLMAAERHGRILDPEAWRGVLRTFGDRQVVGRAHHGGWGYTTNTPYGSMTCAGICSTAIALRRFDPTADPRADLRIRDGLAWLDRNWTVEENPGKDDDWRYYYLYGLERVGRVLDLEFLGGHEWYPEGARFLVDAQRGDGSWAGTGGETAPIATSFALLFLTRATESLELEEPEEPAGPGELRTRVEQPPGPDRVYLVLDASGSMLSALGGQPKFDLAREAVRAFAAALPDGVPLALRAYGHRKRAIEEGAAEDTELVLPLAALDRARLEEVLAGLRARGKTPISLSLEQAAADLRGTPADGGRTLVVLLTDGGEDTRRDPLPAARALAELPDTRLVVVGLDISRPEWTRELQAVAEAAGGEYVPADDAAALAARLESSAGMSTPRFELRGADGEPVAAGTFGDTVALAPGPYTLRFQHRGEPVETELWIHPDRTTWVRLDPRADARRP